MPSRIYENTKFEPIRRNNIFRYSNNSATLVLLLWHHITWGYCNGEVKFRELHCSDVIMGANVTSAMAKVMFSSLSLGLSVCLSVCLRVDGTWYKEQLETGCSIWPLEHRIFFPLFLRNPCLLAALQKNGWTDFHEIFRKGRTWHKEQAGIVPGCYG